MSGDQAGNLRTVRLEDLPVGSLLALRSYVDDLLHEFRVIGSGLMTGTLDAEVPRRLAALMEEFNERFASPRLLGRRAVDEAAARGDETVTIEIVLPADAAAAVEQYLLVVEEADEYCRRGELLTLAPSPELAGFRRQMFEDIIRQLR